jgi:hypothetical protein
MTTMEPQPASAGYLTIEQIRAVNDERQQDVDVPEWGGKVRVRSLTTGEKQEFEQGMIKIKGKHRDVNLQNLRERLIVKALVHPQMSQADIRWLAEKNSLPVSRVYDVAAALSGLSDDDVEDLVGKSETTQESSSSSSSLSNSDVQSPS